MTSVEGIDDGNTGYGVRGLSEGGKGVYGRSNRGAGVTGAAYSYLGVHGYSYWGHGVYGSSEEGYGVYGRSYRSYGVYGSSVENIGVYGDSDASVGVRGSSRTGDGVHGYSNYGNGLYGISFNYNGVSGVGTGNGVSGVSDSGNGLYGRSFDGNGVYGSSRRGYAAYLEGNVRITGNLQKGGGSFKIDHPLDPANKYLSHSFVESPDMKNVYDGVAVLDNNGEAKVELPDWFGALNKDFRYQLTAIGSPGPNLHIAEEIADVTTTNNNRSHFKIAGGTSGMKVSWQVTGIRKDPWANANRIHVEEDKPAKERGYYIYPDVYGQPEERAISHLLFPEEEKWQEVPVK